PLSTSAFLAQPVRDSVITIQIGDKEGWRGLALSATKNSFGELLDGLGGQVASGSNKPDATPAIITWMEKEGGSFAHPGTLTEAVEGGRGYFVYLSGRSSLKEAFKEGGFPKIIRVDRSNLQQTVTVEVGATDSNENGSIDAFEGFNLIGNPFGQAISAGALMTALRANEAHINENLYLWKAGAGDGNGMFEPVSGKKKIPPYKAFWVRYLNPGFKKIIRFDSTALELQGRDNLYIQDAKSLGSFNIRLSDGERFDSFRIGFKESGEVGEDRWDGYKIASLNSQAINLFSTLSSGTKISKNILPLELDGELEILLSFSAADEQLSFSFLWEAPDEIPAGWELMLVDRQEDRKINLRSSTSYSFHLSGSNRVKEKRSDGDHLPHIDVTPDSEGRFAMLISPSSRALPAKQPLPEAVSLKPNYPNPFTTTTTIP